MTIEMCTKTVDATELSKVGPLLSLQKDVDMMCPGAAHPSNDHDFKTIDVRNQKELEITDIFKPEDVYKALMNDQLVKTALNSADSHPKNYYELKAALSHDDGIPVLDSKAPYRLDRKLFSEFAFHHLDGGNVAVRLKTEQVGGADRNLITQIGILLPIPESMKGTFASADKGQAGQFLMKDSARLGKHSTQHFEFDPDTDYKEGKE